MLEHEPMEVQSRGRIYTTEDQRTRLGIDGAGYEESLAVGLTVVDRSPDWGSFSRAAQFQVTLGQYGEFRIPVEVRERLGVEEGDHVRLTARTTYPTSELE